jgi:hypothetical protein
MYDCKLHAQEETHAHKTACHSRVDIDSPLPHSLGQDQFEEVHMGGG